MWEPAAPVFHGLAASGRFTGPGPALRGPNAHPPRGNAAASCARIGSDARRAPRFRRAGGDSAASAPPPRGPHWGGGSASGDARNGAGRAGRGGFAPAACRHESCEAQSFWAAGLSRRQASLGVFLRAETSAPHPGRSKPVFSSCGGLLSRCSDPTESFGVISAVEHYEDPRLTSEGLPSLLLCLSLGDLGTLGCC